MTTTPSIIKWSYRQRDFNTTSGDMLADRVLMTCENCGTEAKYCGLTAIYFNESLRKRSGDLCQGNGMWEIPNMPVRAVCKFCTTYVILLHIVTKK
jgi:hypothetical protein